MRRLNLVGASLYLNWLIITHHNNTLSLPTRERKLVCALISFPWHHSGLLRDSACGENRRLAMLESLNCPPGKS